MVCLFPVALIIALEAVFKSYAEESFSQAQVRPLGKWLLLRCFHNSGAFWGFLKKRQAVLLALSCVLTAAVGLFFLVTLFQRGNGLLKLGLALLLGGAFSNTYDRLRHHYVVDYFSFLTPFPAFNRIVFNISDFCILVGSLFYLIHRFKEVN